ncbi:hypothetical protein JCGZ_08785 [Jatropha curcas]|uniref:Transcription repressor n=1 Tax=Jatropha curcas TaxID=180498 RepID=A0A067KIT2_JATCU|nr:hypothetical protein JCGZ_08785 [Jatropha curcas]
MSTSKKRFIFNTVSVNLGCNSCKKPNLSNIFHPKPKPTMPTTSTTAFGGGYYKHYNHGLYYSSSTSSKTNPSPTEYDDTTTTSFSPATDTTPYNNFSFGDKKVDKKSSSKCSRTVRGLGRVGGESVAVEKDSDDPYLDFRQSMLQMILEKEIYSKDDLKELLECFLQLNSPYHHGIIVRAFTEIWNGVFSVRSSSSSGANNSRVIECQQKLHWNYYDGYGYDC